MSNLTLRLIFGSLYVGLFIVTLHWGSAVFGIFLAILCFLALNEMATLGERTTNQLRFVNPLLFAGIIVYATSFDTKPLNINHYAFAFAAQLITIAGVYLQLKKKQIQYSLATLYIWLPLAAIAIWFDQSGNLLATTVSVKYMLFFLITVWGYDSLAYVVGKLMGRRPIFPKVSPKKTIEGTIGGSVFTLALMFILNEYVFHLRENAIIMGAVVIFFGILGDFTESYLKRSIGVKDSGSLIPGHGGILDRIDSILLAAIPYLIIIEIL